MTFIFEGVLLAVPRISVILFPLIILIYVFAVLCTSLFGPNSYEFPSSDYWRLNYSYAFDNGTTAILPGANYAYDYYGNIAKSMFTLFQVMTGDSWSSEIARPTMARHQWAFIIFIVFYSLFNFILLNAFTGIMVNALQAYEEKKHVPNPDREIPDDHSDISRRKSVLSTTSTISAKFMDSDFFPPKSPPNISSSRTLNIDHGDEHGQSKLTDDILLLNIIQSISGLQDNQREITEKISYICKRLAKMNQT
jgi:hypothetical protein